MRDASLEDNTEDGGISHLVDIRLGSGSGLDNLLHKSRNLGHDVYPVKPLSENSLNNARHLNTVLCLAGPSIFGLAGRRPIGCRVPRRLDVGDGAIAADTQNFIFLGNNADTNACGSVGRWCGEFHENRRVRWSLEIHKIPFGCSMVRLHSLQGIDEERPPSKVDSAVWSSDCSFARAPGPERMPDGAPGICQVGTKEGCASCSGVNGRGFTSDCHIDDTSFVGQALDRVGSPILGKLDCAVVGIEACLILTEVGVGQLGRRPEGRLVAVQREDLCGELAGGVKSAKIDTLLASRTEKELSPERRKPGRR